MLDRERSKEMLQLVESYHRRSNAIFLVTEGEGGRSREKFERRNTTAKINTRRLEGSEDPNRKGAWRRI